MKTQRFLYLQLALFFNELFSSLTSRHFQFLFLGHNGFAWCMRGMRSC